MALSEHADVAILEIVCYALLLPICIYNNLRFGFTRESGWILLTVHCAIRIAGSAMFVAETKNASKGYITATLILLQIALGPLISALVAFINLSYKRLNIHKGGPVERVFKLTHLVVLAAIVLGIVGGINRANATKPSSLDQAVKIVQASVCLLLVALVFATGLFVLGFPNRHEHGDLQRKLFPAIAVSLPFLWVRIIYSMLGAFKLNTSKARHTQKFSTTSQGNWVIYLLLGALTQIIVVALWAGAGMIAKKEEKQWDREMEMDRSEQVGPDKRGQHTYTK